MDMIRGANPTAYDLVGDPKGEIFWRKIAALLSEEEPFKITPPKKKDLKSIDEVVTQIITQFAFLIEKRRYSEDLYYQGKPRPEKAAQKLFFAVAYSYCKANDIDIIPEAETGAGPVDFKFSSGFKGRVLVEIKLSTNRLEKGYANQLEAYKDAEESINAYFVVIDVGHLGDKYKNVQRLRREALERGEPASEIVLIDGERKVSASKR